MTFGCGDGAALRSASRPRSGTTRGSSDVGCRPGSPAHEGLVPRGDEPDRRPRNARGDELDREERLEQPAQQLAVTGVRAASSPERRRQAFVGRAARRRGEERDELLGVVPARGMAPQGVGGRLGPAVALVEDGEVEQPARRLVCDERADAASQRAPTPAMGPRSSRAGPGAPEGREDGRRAGLPLEEVPCRCEPEGERLVRASQDPVGSHRRRPEVEQELDVLAGERQPPPLQRVEHRQGERVRRFEGDDAVAVGGFLLEPAPLDRRRRRRDRDGDETLGRLPQERLALGQLTERRSRPCTPRPP